MTDGLIIQHQYSVVLCQCNVYHVTNLIHNIAKEGTWLLNNILNSQSALKYWYVQRITLLLHAGYPKFDSRAGQKTVPWLVIMVPTQPREDNDRLHMTKVISPVVTLPRANRVSLAYDVGVSR